MMTRLRTCFLLAVLAVCFPGPRLTAGTTNEMPDFKDVYGVVRAHAPWLNADELNRAAVRGLLSDLGPRVSLVTGAETNAASKSEPLVIKSNVLESNVAYIRVGRVAEGLADALRGAYQKMPSASQSNGLVIDLRYAGGDDYAAAAAAADLFVKKKQPLLEWGHGMIESTEKDQPLASPIAVLVNEKTAGAAEAMAAVLREAGAALILGGQTAGQAMTTQDYPLSNGQQLRIATTPIEIGGDVYLSVDGVKPDIAIVISPQDEKAFYDDPFRWVPRKSVFASSSASTNGSDTATNRAARRSRFNEAELVRERREGLSRDDALTGLPDDKAQDTAQSETDAPVVRDPVLARALDLLKGLAVVRQIHS